MSLIAIDSDVPSRSNGESCKACGEDHVDPEGLRHRYSAIVGFPLKESHQEDTLPDLSAVYRTLRAMAYCKEGSREEYHSEKCDGTHMT